MSSINLLLWQVFVFIQTLIFDESNGVFSTSFLNDSILVSPPRVFYVNTSNAVSGFQNTRKGVFRTQLNPSIQTNGNASFSLSKDGPLMYHAKKFSEPWVDGNWGSWGEFGPATKTCDEGFRTRTRQCNNPPPRGQGKPCPGSNKESLLFEMGRCILKSLDTEFKNSDVGIWEKEGNIPWKVKCGSTSADATGDGCYLLADSTGRQREDKAKIISKSFTPAPKVNRACLKFRYQMHGTTGLLSVQVKRGSHREKQIWQAYGENTRQWLKGSVTLKSSVRFKVLFAASVGTPGQSDITLDSIYVDSGPCKCQDDYQSCRDWAEEGKCNDKDDDETYFWLAKHCKTSCKTCYCRDLADSKKCRVWAKQGYCSSHLTWMSSHCQLSCRLCACRDFLSYSECQKKVSDYVCETQPEWMASNCKLSCGFCDCKNLVTEAECHRRMMVGKCESNPVYMSSNCKYSCGYCNCKNRHPKCSTWSAQGECEKNPTWMEAYCTLSCAKCYFPCNYRMVRC